MNMIKLLVPGIMVLAALGCTTSPQNTPSEYTVEEMRAKSLAEVDQAACDAKDGNVRQAGMMGLWRCVVPYGDAGESCTDKSQCEGLCLAMDGVTDYEAPTGEAKGLCKADDSPFGCYAELQNGSVIGIICVD